MECQVFNLSKVTRLVTGGAGARTPQSRTHHTPITLALQCFQRFCRALRINSQTPSSRPHLPPLQAGSLAFLPSLQHRLLLPTPGPLHMLHPLCEILPTRFSRFRPTPFIANPSPLPLLQSHHARGCPSPPLLSCHNLPQQIL